MLDYGAKKRPQRVEKASKREKKTKEIMEVLYNFHDLREMVKHEKFYERSYIEEFHANCSVSKIRKRLFFVQEIGIRYHYATHKNYRDITRFFGLEDSTAICKAVSP